MSAGAPTGMPLPTLPALTGLAPGTVSTAAVPIAEGLAVLLPERLQALTRAVVLSGQVVQGEAPAGHARVRTQAGDLVLRLEGALPRDAALILQIPPGAPPERVLVFTAAPQAPPRPPGAARSPQPGPSAVAPETSVVTRAESSQLALKPGDLVAVRVQASPGSPPASAPSSPPGPVQATPTAPPAPPPAPPPAAPAAATTRAPTPPASSSAALPPGAASPGVPATRASIDTPPPGQSPGSRPAAAAAPVPTGAPPIVATTPSAPTVRPPAPGTDAISRPQAPGSATPAEAPEAPPPTRLAPGTTLTARVVAVIPPGTNATAESPSARPPEAPPDPRPALGRAAARPAAPPPAAPAAPPAAGPEVTAPPEPMVLRGTVIGQTTTRLPLVTTPQGLLILAKPGLLPPGTEIVLAAETGVPAEATPPAAPEGGWPALKAVQDALAGFEPPPGAAAFAVPIPRPNRQLASSLLFVLSALRAGDTGGWLGPDASEALQRSGQAQLLEALAGELRAAGREVQDATGQDWRQWQIPWLDGEQLAALRWSVRRLRDDEPAEQPERHRPGTRFLVDVTLSALGPLQLDGLIEARRFDLIVRCQSALPEPLQTDLARTFAEYLPAIGYTGRLVLRAGTADWPSLAPSPRLGVTA